MNISANVSAESVAYMNQAMRQMEKDFGKGVKLMPKQISVDVCNSLKSKTKKAPKRARPKEYDLVISPVPPRYITTKRGVLHRWQLTRKLGTPDQYVRQYYAYAHLKHNKAGRIVKDLAAEKAEIRKYHLGISRAGLAKKSFDWIKGEIKGGGADMVWTRRKGERRDPRRSVDGKYVKTSDGASATIDNRLDYIRAALKPMAVEQAMKDAIAKRAFLTARAQNMSVEDAKAYARDLASGFVAA